MSERDTFVADDALILRRRVVRPICCLSFWKLCGRHQIRDRRRRASGALDGILVPGNAAGLEVEDACVTDAVQPFEEFAPLDLIAFSQRGKMIPVLLEAM